MDHNYGDKCDLLKAAFAYLELPICWTFAHARRERKDI